MRTTYWVVQIGSRFARLACGTKRSTLPSAARARFGIASMLLPRVAAEAFKNTRRSMLRFVPVPSFLSHAVPDAAVVPDAGNA